jgi:hypothetical protein
MNVLHQVITAEPVDDKRVRVSFENGVQGLFDCSSYMTDRYCDSLNNPSIFRQVRVECGTLCWPNDIDIDLEEVWEFCTP